MWKYLYKLKQRKHLLHNYFTKKNEIRFIKQDYGG